MILNLDFGIFCRTYSKDAERLRFLLISIEKFATGFRQVIVACPHTSVTDIEPIVADFDFVDLKVCPELPNDYIGQQITKLTADRYVDTDYITHIDSDCIFIRPFSPEDLLSGLLPTLYHASYSHFYQNKIHLPWQSPTSALLGDQVDQEFMRSFPLTYPRRLYEDFANHFRNFHGRPIDEIHELVHGDLLSEFNLLGAYSFRYGEKYNKHIDIVEAGIKEKPLVKQMCLDNARNDRLIRENDAATIRDVLGIGDVADIRVPRKSLMAQEEFGMPDTSGAVMASQTDAAKASNEAQPVKLDAIGEMELFRAAQLWDGGYIDADPLDPVAWSSYSTTGFISVYHATFLACIKPFITKRTVALEIGPGRGAWTKAILTCGAQSIYTLDVQTRETNTIDDVLGALSARLNYIVVKDFSGEGVPDDSIDFFWSFGTFVHLSRGQQEAYYSTLARKMKLGAVGFVQLADIPTWNKVVTTAKYHIHNVLSDRLPGHEADQMRSLLASSPIIAPREEIPAYIADYEVPDPGRYFYVGLDWVEATLERLGFEVVHRSVFDSLRDPVLQFRKT